MARRAVVEIRCSRCQRVEYRDAGAPVCNLLAILREGDEEAQPLIDIEFEELCASCRKTVVNHLEQIGRQLKGCSPERQAKGTVGPAQPDRPKAAVDDD